MNQSSKWTDPQWVLSGAANALGVLVIGFLFLVSIMVATAQQDVITRMKAEQLAIGYSSALSLRKDANENRIAIPVLQTEAQKAAQKIRSDQTALEEAQRQAELAWGEFETGAARIAKSGLCDVSVPVDSSARARAVASNEIIQCTPDANPGARGLRSLQAAKDQANQFMGELHGYLERQSQLNSDQSHLAAVQEQLQFRALTADQQKVLRSFGDMDVLLQPWMVGGSFLVQFPPALLQILLSFVSGLFGALLITLILIVYPNNLISEKVDTHPAKRIAVGGMIALCVYIVLLSGTAVLGSGTGSEGAGTNYMAFTGIGILAGMFSDKVAGWLSKQAETLFRD